MKPEPTKRAVIDIGRRCNLNCRFCYHKHLGDLTRQTFEPFEKVRHDIDMAMGRGNKYIDVTGGEPTIYPDICGLIEYARETCEMKTRVITNAMIGEGQTKKIIDAGVSEFLVSIHGMTEAHDFLVQYEGARKKQERFLKQIKGVVPFAVNYVINAYNQNDLIDMANYLAKWEPYAVNFINFNPHHGWGMDKNGTKTVIADLRQVEKKLNFAIPILEENGIGVNLRYYPMCRISRFYRKCVCNDLHVTFDPYEWDYCIYPKLPETHLRWGIAGSHNVENKGHPCHECDLQFICGGINKLYNEASEGKMVDAVKEDVDKFEFYHYRQDNALTLGRTA